VTTPITTRFAPSPTGLLHVGHAYSAMIASHFGNGYLLRIDDIDHTRCRPEYVDQICRDLEFLGLPWQGEPVFQSHRLEAYNTALERLRERDLVYPCFLTRSELAEVLTAPQEAPVATDRALPDDEKQRRADAGKTPAWRLRTELALKDTGTLAWHDRRNGIDRPIDMKQHGDVVVARRDIGTSYHLSVVIDDALDGISLVTRGVDLEASTHVHRLLQALLDLPTPEYFHHDLVRDAGGNRLAKRDDAVSISHLRADGLDPTDIFAQMPRLPTRT
jgi:glutamyl-Q tRNA(Asp) synthetase